MRKILHKHLVIGDEHMSCNRTLCGKEQWQGGLAKDGGGTNIAVGNEEVTCKLCLRMMKNGKTN